MEKPSKAEGWAWGYRRVMSLTLVPSKTEGWGYPHPWQTERPFPVMAHFPFDWRWKRRCPD